MKDANMKAKKRRSTPRIDDSVHAAIRRSMTALFVYLALVMAVFAQTQKKQLTLEWIFGPEGRSVASLPSTSWLDDGTLIIRDSRRSDNDWAFEKLDPVADTRTPLVHK